MLHLFRNTITVSFLKPKFFSNYSTKGIGKWADEISSQVKIEIENHWRQVVSCTSHDETIADKFYVLSMFPYPSGQLHMGHVRVYTISDSIARFQRMNGKQVIHPMGWDAFGLPAENAAIERQIPPRIWTKSNIQIMKEKLIDLGCLFDWDREIDTSDPSYYKWTQALFLELYKSGLVYKKEAYVNWDPVDQTVLADEQVDINGCSWRSGAKVEKKILNQWFIKTTKFAKDLYDGLDDPVLQNWKDIIDLQKHWIGNCDGITIDFRLFDNDNIQNNAITVWTDKPEILLCAEFIAVSPNSILDNKKLYINEHESYKQLKLVAENPITMKKIPIFVTNEVLYSEGTDTYLGSPHTNELDEMFFMKTKLPCSSYCESFSLPHNITKNKIKVCETALKMNVGGYPVSSKLKDWLISRQRYWGTPIPIINCQSCGIVPVPLEDLPVTLPSITILDKNIKLHTSKYSSWIDTTCPNCGCKATRETDTMDTFVDSSWYFLRYIDPKNATQPFDIKKVFRKLPVDLYIGGKEHAVLHLYYARFMSHFLHSLGKVPEKEPFKKLLVQGMVMGEAFRIKETGIYIPKSEVEILNVKKGNAVTKKDNKPVEIIWEKMSKSKYNGVDPTELIEQYGCDTTRLFMLGDVSPSSPRHWSSATFPGILNWQRKLWLTIQDLKKCRSNNVSYEDKEKITTSEEFIKNEQALKNSRNNFIISTTINYNYYHSFSVVISRLQELSNVLRKVSKKFIAISEEYERTLACLIIMLAPIAPHFASELWSGLTYTSGSMEQNRMIFKWNSNVLDQKWPVVDTDYKLNLICKINGNDIGSLKILPQELNNLNLKSALEHIYKEQFSSKIKTEAISTTFLEIFPNCKATLYFWMDYTKINKNVADDKLSIKKLV